MPSIDSIQKLLATEFLREYQESMIRSLDGAYGEQFRKLRQVRAEQEERRKAQQQELERQRRLSLWKPQYDSRPFKLDGIQVLVDRSHSWPKSIAAVVFNNTGKDLAEGQAVLIESTPHDLADITRSIRPITVRKEDIMPTPDINPMHAPEIPPWILKLVPEKVETWLHIVWEQVYFLIQLAEVMFGGGGTGEAKKAYVKEMLRAHLQALAIEHDIKRLPDWVEHPAESLLIDLVVEYLVDWVFQVLPSNMANLRGERFTTPPSLPGHLERIDVLVRAERPLSSIDRDVPRRTRRVGMAMDMAFRMKNLANATSGLVRRDNDATQPCPGPTK